mmetsp:Transcript_20641/g.35464  ORF Transcript_20641/g.35464 Transcript_20641/m.35464 type:complete len:229 (+) Transcript_20641:353-1039(+)
MGRQQPSRTISPAVARRTQTAHRGICLRIRANVTTSTIGTWMWPATSSSRRRPRTKNTIPIVMTMGITARPTRTRNDSSVRPSPPVGPPSWKRPKRRQRDRPVLQLFTPSKHPMSTTSICAASPLFQRIRKAMAIPTTLPKSWTRGSFLPAGHWARILSWKRRQSREARTQTTFRLCPHRLRRGSRRRMPAIIRACASPTFVSEIVPRRRRRKRIGDSARWPSLPFAR